MTDGTFIPLDDPSLAPPRYGYREPIDGEHLLNGGGHFTRDALIEFRDAIAGGWKPSWR